VLLKELLTATDRPILCPPMFYRHFSISDICSDT